MTHSFRTPAEIRADIDAVSKRVDATDAGKRALVEAARDELALDWHIVGFNDGTGLDAPGVRRSVLHARLYPTKALAVQAERQNGQGEWAIATPYRKALDVALELQWRRYDAACKVFQELHEELAAAQAAADLKDTIFDMAAMDGLYDMEADKMRAVENRASMKWDAGLGTLVIRHVYPPIPDRSHDWCAYWDNDVEIAELYGWGPTREIALHDLGERIMAWEEERA